MHVWPFCREREKDGGRDGPRRDETEPQRHREGEGEGEASPREEIMTGSGSWRSKCGLGWQPFARQPSPFPARFSTSPAGWHTDLCDCVSVSGQKSQKSQSDRIGSAPRFPPDQRASESSDVATSPGFAEVACAPHKRKHEHRERIPICLEGAPRSLPRLKGCVTMWYWRIIFAR